MSLLAYSVEVLNTSSLLITDVITSFELAINWTPSGGLSVVMTRCYRGGNVMLGTISCHSVDHSPCWALVSVIETVILHNILIPCLHINKLGEVLWCYDCEMESLNRTTALWRIIRLALWMIEYTGCWGGERTPLSVQGMSLPWFSLSNVEPQVNGHGDDDNSQDDDANDQSHHRAAVAVLRYCSCMSKSAIEIIPKQLSVKDSFI